MDLPTNQSNGDVFLIEVPSAQLTLPCIQAKSKTNKKNKNLTFLREGGAANLWYVTILNK